jgi:hypothetical protein
MGGFIPLRILYVFNRRKEKVDPLCTDMRRLTTELRSEKCVVRRFRRCASVIECTYTNVDSIAYYTPSLFIVYYS